MSPHRALASCREVLQFFKEEGDLGAMVHSQVCVAHGDYARASAMASLVARMKKDCQGYGADAVEQYERLIQAPQSHRLAGTT